MTTPTEPAAEPQVSQETPTSEQPSFFLSDFFLVIVLGFAIGILLSAVLALVLDLTGLSSLSDDNVGFNFASVAFVYIGVAIAVHLLVVARRNVSWGELGLRRPMGNFVGITLLVWGGTLVATTAVATLVASLVDDAPDVGDQLGMASGAGLSPLEIAVILVATVLAPAIVEEVVFRTLLFCPLRRRWGFLPTAAVTSAVFAAIHAPPLVIPVLLILGVSLAWLRERFDSLYPPILLHGLNNGLAMIIFLTTT